MNVPGQADDVVVGICTFRRPLLAETLASLAGLAPCGPPVAVVVADNDVHPSAEALVTEVARNHPLPIRYIHAPAANISIARNAILAAARRSGSRWLAFIDDDERVEPGWLGHLLDTAAATGAGAVLGPVLAEFPDRVPGWVRRAGLHDVTPVFGRDGRITTGHAGNVLLDLCDPACDGLQFDIGRGRSGGEDTAFFSAFVAAGGQIGHAPEAIVRETIPAERLTLRWLLRRRFRMGQTHGDLLRLGRSPLATVAQAGIAASKAAACLGMAALRVGDSAQRNRQLVRSALHMGVVAKLAGVADLQLYGAPRRPREGGDDASA